MTLKQVLIFVVIVLSATVIVIGGFGELPPRPKYEIEYGWREYGHHETDGADSITYHPDGCIEYIDVFRKQRQRQCGTYKVIIKH